MQIGSTSTFDDASDATPKAAAPAATRRSSLLGSPSDPKLRRTRIACPARQSAAAISVPSAAPDIPYALVSGYSIATCTPSATAATTIGGCGRPEPVISDASV